MYSLTDENSKGIPTLRLQSSRFLVYQSFATSSNIEVPNDLSLALQRSRNQITETNIIPIGILNAEIDFLNKKEKELVIAASPLQEDIFQADVQFKISPKLMQINLVNSIESIELSFDEGKNWKSYSFSEQLISHHFDKTDEQTIGIKLNTKKGTYITFTEINVRQLERPKVFLTKSVTVKSAISNPKAKVLENVSGGEYRILLGCDGIFDRPVIIAEGFDAGNSVNLDDITAKYYRYLYTLRNNGFDLVVVNYNDGRTFIQNNGNVLIAVINQVNATKVGNNKLVVIGESMSGLVARWALTDMEMSGITHNVSHFVAFDSPMQGANVPPGFIALRRWIPNAAFPVSNIFSLLNDIFNVIPEVRAIDQPAAKQLLLTTEGGSPASEFTTFQAILNNIGYPRQNGIRNIALINGSINGTRQSRFSVSNNVLTPIAELNPGDQLMDNTELLVLNMDVWSNNPNVNTRVFRGQGIGTPQNIFVTLPNCLDRVPGGRISFSRGSIYSSFSFVPTFSSIDFRGNLNNDEAYTFSMNNFLNNNIVTNPALTPFVSIYGTNTNTYHASPKDKEVIFHEFAEREFNLVRTFTTCTPPQPPVPSNIQWGPDPTEIVRDESVPWFQFEIPRVLCKNVPSNGNFFNIGFKKNYTEEGLDGTYTTLLRINRPNGTSAEFANSQFNGFALSNSTLEGLYTISTFRRYFGATNNEVRNSVTLDVRGNCPARNSCNYNDGDFLGYNFQNFFVRVVGGKYYGVTSDGAFRARSFLQSKNLPNVFLSCLEETDTRGSDCNFAISASASPNSVGCGGTTTLLASCSGSGCSGISYTWNGNNNNYSGSIVSLVRLPSNNGSVIYTLTGSQTGCNNQTAIIPVSVSGCGGGTPSCDNGTSPFSIVSANYNSSNRCVEYQFNANNLSNANWSISSTTYNGALPQPINSNNGTVNCGVILPDGTYNFVLNGVSCSGTASKSFTVSGNGTGGTDPDRTESGLASDDGVSNPGNEDEPKAFDNSNFTKWLVFSPTGNIAYDFSGNDAYAINQYTVTTANDEPSRDPKNWVLEGSNDGSNWNMVDIQNDQFFNSPRFNPKTYNIDNQTTAYQMYRLRVTANHGNGLLQIAEIQMFGPSGSGGCTPPPPPSISSNTTTAPANLTATGCGGAITWSNNSNENPLNGVGDGIYTATCTVNNCTSGSSNSISIGSGSCPSYPNAPQWFHWDNASSSLWFAHYGPTGKLYAATDANPATPALTRQQLINSGVTPTLANCFLDGTKSRGVATKLSMVAIELQETDMSTSIFPNPTTGKIKIVFSLTKSENVWLNLYDIQGKSLDLRDFEGKTGRNEMEYDLQNYPSGAYFVDFQSSEKREVLKVMKVN